MQTDFVNYAEDNVVAVEDEIHVMFECEAYNDIRNLYTDRDALTCDNECNYIKLRNADNIDCIVKLANFVLCMFNPFTTK